MNHPKVLLTALLIFIMSSSFIRYDEQDKKKILADKAVSEITYSMVHPLHEWTGTSKDINGIIIYHEGESRIESVAISVLLSTFDSKNSNRDSHALEVLDAIKYPTVKFSSRTIQQNGDDLTITGNLIFHNVTKPVTIMAKQTKDKKKLWVTGSFTVDMTEYQIEQPSLMGFKTEKEIGMNFKIAFPLSNK